MGNTCNPLEKENENEINTGTGIYCFKKSVNIFLII